MTSPLTITIPNKSRVMARLSGWRAGLELNGSKIEKELAEEIAVVAADLAPVDTGKTAASVHVDKRDGAYAVVVDRKGDHPDVPVYLEFGTRNMAARPFLVPASDIVQAAGGIGKVTRSVGGLLA